MSPFSKRLLREAKTREEMEVNYLSSKDDPSDDFLAGRMTADQASLAAVDSASVRNALLDNLKEALWPGARLSDVEMANAYSAYREHVRKLFLRWFKKEYRHVHKGGPDPRF
jgi:hypothetical protein